MYTADDFIGLFRAQGFEADEVFGSAISFTRDLEPAYRDLIEEMPPEILDLYNVKISGDRAALAFNVLNVRFVAPGD
jgi:hypothetical protein